MNCNFKCSVSKLAQICQFSLRTGSFVQKLGKREKERRGGGVRGREIENEPAGMTFNLEWWTARIEQVPDACLYGWCKLFPWELN